MSATITCHGVPSGQSLTAKLFADGGDTEIDSGSFTPATNRKGTGSFAATGVTGLHKIELRTSGGVLFWYGWAVLATSGNIEASDSRDEALINLQTEKLQFDGDNKVLAAASVTLSDQNISDIAGAVSDELAGRETTVTLEGPVLTNGNPLTIVIGDDYLNETTDRRISATINGNGYGSLTTDTWRLRLNTRGADAVVVTGEAESLSSDSIRIKFPVTATQSGGLVATEGEWSVRRNPVNTTANFDVIRGPLIASRDLSIRRT